MRDPIVSEANVLQIVQAMYENVKSNQHRLDTTEPMLRTMSEQVNRLNTLLVENGYAKAVEDNAADLKAFRKDFQQFLLVREETCPTAKRSRDKLHERDKQINRQVALSRLGIAALALIPTIILVIDRIGG